MSSTKKPPTDPPAETQSDLKQPSKNSDSKAPPENTGKKSGKKPWNEWSTYNTKPDDPKSDFENKM